MLSRPLWLMTLGALAILLWSVSWWMRMQWSPLNGDAYYFVPVSTSLSRGEGMNHPWWQQPSPAVADSPMRYNWHGPMAPWLWSALASDSTLAGAKAGLYRNALIGYVLMIAAMLRHAGAGCRPGFVAGGTFFLLLLGSGWLFQPHGRPEILASSFVALGFLIEPKAVSHRWSVLWGCVIGFVAACSPLAGLPVAGMALLRLASKNHTRLLLADVLLMGLCSIAAFVGLLETIGYGTLETLQGIKLHAQSALWGKPEGSFSPYWLFLTDCPGLLFHAVILGALCARPVGGWMKGESLATGSVLLLAALLMVVTAGELVPVRGKNYYNLIPFMAGLMILVAKKSWPSFKFKDWTVLAIGMSLPCIGLARHAFILSNACRHEPSFRQTAELLASDLANLKLSSGNVVLSESLFEFADDPVLGGQVSVLGGIHAKPEASLIFAQAYSGLVQPPRELGESKILVNRFSLNQSKIFGFGIARTAGGYGYAIYQKPQD